MKITITNPNVFVRGTDGTRLPNGPPIDVSDGLGAALIARDDAERIDGCQATTADGTPCQRDASDGDYCHQHGDE